MAILNILHYPDNRLRTVARKVQQVTKKHQKLMDDMLETMYQAPGIGLAATQVNVHEQIIVIDISEEKNSPLFLVNPQIISSSGTETMEEGCLSVPDIQAEVQRAEKITFTARDKNGESYQMDAEGLLAVCVQHEIDHLKGKLFVDYLSRLKQQRIKKKLLKLKNR